MIEVRIASIENCSADIIVNASNGIGYMGGFIGRFIKLKGVAESLHYATKGAIERESKNLLKREPIEVGKVFITSEGNLNAKKIIHAVTMKKPGQKSSIEIVEECLKNIIQAVNSLNAQTVCIPALGTGTGKVNKTKVADLFYNYLKDEKVKYIIIDPNGDFSRLFNTDKRRF
ncbi:MULTISPECIES: macro domain-containing protein [Bacillota]|uniref:macro domain-containing protein n=1 Tax=Bacillota TaxID=1239 RepID=UPI0039F032D2